MSITRNIVLWSLLAASCLSLRAQGQTAQPGPVRIGVLMPVYPGASLQAAEALQTFEIQLLAGQNVQVTKLTAIAGATCDYVLTTTVNQKKSSGFGGLKGLSALRQVSPMIPGAGITKAATALQTAAVAANVAEIASGVTAKSEVIFGYSLTNLSGQQVLNQVEKATAKSNGEDVITPMVQSAVGKIIAAAKH